MRSLYAIWTRNAILTLECRKAWSRPPSSICSKDGWSLTKGVARLCSQMCVCSPCSAVPFPSEACLCQVDTDPGRSLRSQGAFLFVRSSPALIVVWAGSLCSTKLRETAQKFGAHLAEQMPSEFSFIVKPTVRLCLEGQDPGGLYSKELVIPRPLDFDSRDTIRLLRITTSGGNQFGAVEAVSSWFSAKMPAAFPYEQDDLYGASQPAVFLLDQTNRLWVWEGFIDTDDQDEAVVHKMRLQRVFALKLAASYWKARHEDSDKRPARVVFAGLEPAEFKALFPVWVDQRGRGAVEFEGKTVLQPLRRFNRSIFCRTVESRANHSI